MSVDHQQLQEQLQLLQSYQELQAKRQKVQEQLDQIARARSQRRRSPSASEDASEDLDADREVSPSQESDSSDDDSDEDMDYTVPPPSIAESPSPGPAAPSEETLRRFATTVAYSSYTRLCGTSDDILIRHLLDDELRKEAAAMLGPKKMVEISQTEHNIAYLWNELARGADTSFVTSMAKARRRFDPQVTTDDHVRRLGPAEILDDSLPMYWIVTFSHQGVVDWEEGCTLARAYHGVFEDFGAGGVHCLVFEREADLPNGDDQKAFAM